MMRSTCLAALVLAAGCFSEPPDAASMSDADGSSTGGSSTSMSSSSTEANDAESSTWFGSTTGLFLTSTGIDTLADTGVADTGSLPPVLDLYNQCDDGTWESSDGATAPTPVTCLNMPPDTNDIGGAWQYPAFPLGGDEDVLILRPYPVDGGLLQASFNAGEVGIEDGATLRLTYRFVNSAMKGSDVGTMTFQVLITPPDALPGQGMVVHEVFAAGNGTVGTIDMPLSIMGNGDDLTFVVLANTFVTGQGVALFDAFIDAP